MKRTFIAAVLMIVSICAAQAFGLGRLGSNFGHLGAPLGGMGHVVPPPSSGSALLINGTDPALFVDGTDPACLVGGC